MRKSPDSHPEVKKMLSSLPRSFQINRVFLRKVNGQYKPFNNFRISWESARKRAGLEDFVFHDFRHVAISNLRKEFFTVRRHHRTSFPLPLQTIFSLNQLDLRLTMPNILVEYIEVLLCGGY